MSRYVFDIETDGLLRECTKLWVVVAHNLDTGEKINWKVDEMGWKLAFSKATLLAGHNIINFDLAALEKLFDFKPNKNCKIHDTLLMSQILDYRRFGTDGHSLDRWGQELKYPKGNFNDWSKYSEEMLIYCTRDVDLNVKVYETLLDEFRFRVKSEPLIKEYMQAEHAAAQWISKANLHGWPFDVQAAKELEQQLQDEMDIALETLSERLGYKTVAKDKCKDVVAVKKPKWTKQGFYDAHTANWFGIHPCSGFEGEERLVAGEYCRVEIVPLKLSSVADVKIFLFRNGWVPTEYNYKMDERQRKKVPTSPKITEDSLELLGGDGKLYSDYTTTKSRHAILKTWLANVDEKGNLHGDCMLIGTPSMRARHSIIVNVPSADSKWGKEMRQLFTCKKGWKLIGCDSAGNQARGLAHYLRNDEFTKTLLEGDIHQYNADVLTSVLKKRLGINYQVPRSNAKRVLYAFLFGANGGLLWSYIFGNLDPKRGKVLKEGFMDAVPGFGDLIRSLEIEYAEKNKTGWGYIYSVAGNRIYVDSTHKLLVYLLQSCEKITCSAAIMLTMERLEAAGIPYIPCIYYHDEEDFMVPEEYAEQAAAIGKQAFADGPKLFGIEIMDGDSKIGKNWYDVH